MSSEAGVGLRDPWSTLLVMGLLGCAVAAVVAVAVSRVLPGSDPAAQTPRRAGVDAAGRAALDLVNFDHTSLGYELGFAPARDELRGTTDTATRTITIFIRAGDAPHLVAHDIGHELGHAFDARFLTDAQRDAFLEERGRPDAAWWPAEDLADDYATGAGDFAETFARCHTASPEFRSRLAEAPANPCASLPPAARLERVRS